MTQNEAYAELASLVARGFDESQPERVTRLKSGVAVNVRCSQCEAMVTNGHACHEQGCPNEVHECRGCAQLVPARVRYCGDCA